MSGMIGHNSRLAELETELEVTRRERDQYRLERDGYKATLDKRDIELRRIGAVLSHEGLSAKAKCAGIAIIRAAGDDGKAVMRNKTLARAASADLRLVKDIANALAETGVIAPPQKTPGKVNVYELTSEAELQAAVEAYRAKIEKTTDNHDASQLVAKTATSSAEPVAENVPTVSATSSKKLHQFFAPVAEKLEAVSVSGSPARTPAREKEPRARLEENKTTTTSSQQASSAREGLLAGEDASNDMIADIVRWMPQGNPTLARNWLTSTLRIYGREVAERAYHQLKTDIAEGRPIARKLAVWSQIATRLKAEGAIALPSRATNRAEDLAALERLKARQRLQQQERERSHG